MFKSLSFTDRDGDTVTFENRIAYSGAFVNVVDTDGSVAGAYLSDADLREIRDAINEHLNDGAKVEPVAPFPTLTRALFEPLPPHVDLMERGQAAIYALAELKIEELKKESARG